MKKPIPFGKYYLLERINVGGMAEVFRAKAYGVEGFERLVAVKRILPNIAEDKDFITMFVDEAKIAVQLNHANIAQIFDLGVVDGAYYIALEHIHGRDLRAIFDRCRQRTEPMPIAQACFVLMKVCEGLDYAHNKRDQSGRELSLVHRDVSPQNVLVSFEGEVKLIDFGIAKAAGKGSKTQAGILKGKFGYMSPEQVRGLPIDRRSDIFSCGIVLYELLTGERLFIGESDFSTLEKVRNVEILPPSTYNRKIPDELERIVLKALSKDVEERYQNAIDLHDELQAFVYTAGEFYSRKDLASWMKNTFAKEIEHETAKLEEFRQIPAPPQAQAHDRAATADSRGGRRATLAMPSVAPGPPPPPVNQPVAAKPGAPNDLEWDDDELETQIYDDVDHGDAPAPMAAQAHTPSPVAGPSAPTLLGSSMPAEAQGLGEPDLSSLVQSSSKWPDGSPQRPAACSARMDAVAPMAATMPPPNLANGSNNTPSPFAPETLGEPQEGFPPAPAAEDPSAVVRLLNQSHNQAAEPIYDSAFGGMEPPPQQRSKTPLIIGVIAAVLLLAGGGVGLKLYMDKDDGGGEASASVAPSASGDDGAAEAPAEPAATSADDGTGAARPAVTDPSAPVGTPPAEADMETGFDVIVDPQGAAIMLDGGDVGPAPRRIRNIPAGVHVVEVQAPGFFTKKHEVTVVKGKAETVNIRLDAIDIIGRFTSEPPGAKVTLVSDGVRKRIGGAPAEVKLDPRRTYEVQFKKSGYVTVTKPVQITGAPEVNVAVVMERAEVAVRPQGTRGGSAELLDDPPSTDDSPDPPGSKEPPPEKKDPPPKKDPPAEVGNATLRIGAKPPCKIYLDGKDTGLRTPQRAFTVKAGKHKITLVNNEFGIKQTVSINVKAGEVKPIIKDYTDRIQK